jgi:hypothetical protein
LICSSGLGFPRRIRCAIDSELSVQPVTDSPWCRCADDTRHYRSMSREPASTPRRCHDFMRSNLGRVPTGCKGWNADEMDSLDSWTAGHWLSRRTVILSAGRRQSTWAPEFLASPWTQCGRCRRAGPAVDQQ